MQNNEQNNGVLLFVEDYENMNKFHTQFFGQKCGYEVHIAKTLAAARETLSEIEPGIIILDVDLPDGNGIDFCSEIKNKTNAIIFLYTGKANESDEQRGLNAGADAYFVKAVNTNELAEAIAIA